MKTKAICNQPSPFLDFRESNQITEQDLDNFLIPKNSKEINYYEDFLEMKKNKSKSLEISNDIIIRDLKKLTTTINNVERKIPNQELNKNTKLLVIGHIQSGKTDFMIGLVAKLFDRNKNTKGCNLIFVLSPANKMLLDQTFLRFKNTFLEISLLVDFIKYYDLKEAKKGGYQSLVASLNEGKSIIVFLQKQKDHLNIGVDFLKKMQKSNKIIGNVVILDDEGDAASFDNIAFEEQSTINKNITDLIDASVMYGSSFISITATPFAHIMVEDDYNIKPEYAFILEPSIGYLGLKYFSQKAQEENSKIIKPILWNDNLDWNDGALAITHYLIQCFIFTLDIDKKYKNRKPRMMFNLFREIEEHFKIKEIVQDILDNFKKRSHDLEKNLKIAITDYWQFHSVNDNLIKKLANTLINGIMPKVEIKILNSNDGLDPDIHLDEHNKTSYEIIIGSDKLGRGLTFVDLTIAYVLRRSKTQSNADNVLQIARWFGYREDYKDIIKIFLSEDLIDDYNVTNYAVSELFPLIKEFEEANISFKEIPAIFPIEKMKHDYGPVRRSVVETYWQIGPKSSYMNNKYERIIKKYIKETNDNFFAKFKKIFMKNILFDKYGYPIINLNSLQTFNQNFFDNQSREELNKTYHYLFGLPTKTINDNSNKNLIDQIIDNKNIKKVIVRLINSIKDNKEKSQSFILDELIYKERLLNISSNNETEYYSFGQGNYRGEDIPITNPDTDTLYIDIIPIKVWANNSSIKLTDQKLTRARIFIPKSLIKFRFGIIAKEN